MVEAGLDVDADDADVAEAGLESRLRAVAYLLIVHVGVVGQFESSAGLLCVGTV